ncbi:tRNA (adenine(58)-N(1))-methyltransferase, mitochondrial [Alosa sapidissima]|uniref:tRNA (adenine(58)-N(1))-methyltransferase, mitochondrial n=1 Tax=Alosa sapidissima TaxID=34773 RepID=UPI001C0911B3|nr:tRNA (adenine(58)-N(1))-methyltransferase, mitochondrial [Alosa sapidissima]
MSFSLQLRQAVLVTPRLARQYGVLRGDCHVCLWLNVTTSARHFGSSEDGSSSESPAPGRSRLPLKTTLLGRRRSLSPLERVSRLLPQESLSPDVWQLREGQQEGDEEQSAQGDALNGDIHTYQQIEVSQVEIKRRAEVDSVSGDEGLTSVDSVTPSECVDSSQDSHVGLPGERPLTYGEVVLAERRREKQIGFRKMFPLELGGKLHSTWGWLSHGTIAESPSGSLLRTSLGIPLLLRRPSLEEFTLYMKRGPTISYPKDCAAMLTMMDVNEGDSVLESGSGSGAMSLFLSRAVGSKGRVLSVEVRDDHHRRAALNYKRWRTSWSLRRGEDWPDNVQFHKADLQTAGPLLTGWGFNSMALDMVNPHLVLPAALPHLHPGAVCAVYLANVTQIVDLLEGIRCSKLPLVCERIIEVQYRDWLLAPSFRKDGSFNSRRALSEANPEEEEEEDDESSGEDKEEARSPASRPFGSVPYIARPHPEQGGHTAFLVRLRKILK